VQVLQAAGGADAGQSGPHDQHVDVIGCGNAHGEPAGARARGHGRDDCIPDVFGLLEEVLVLGLVLGPVGSLEAAQGLDRRAQYGLDLARHGDPERIDLTVGDIVGGPVGMIPANATASHFGKASGIVARPWVGDEAQAGREHVAAALMNMVGQATVRLALVAANAHGYPSLVLIGHLADLEGIRKAASMIGSLFGGRIVIPPHPGHAIALGALAYAREQVTGNR